MAPHGGTATRASTRVFNIAELLEKILLELARQDHSYGLPKQLFVLRRVNTSFQTVIASSKELRERMWLSLDKETAEEDHYAPMRWLIKFLQISHSPRWMETAESFGPRWLEPTEYLEPQAQHLEGHITIVLDLLRLRCTAESGVLGHTLHFEELWARAKQIRPSWWDMKMFRDEKALPLHIDFDVEYSGQHFGRYSGEMVAKSVKSPTLGEFVSQYLKATKMTDRGGLLESHGVGLGEFVVVDMFQGQGQSADGLTPVE